MFSLHEAALTHLWCSSIFAHSLWYFLFVSGLGPTISDFMPVTLVPYILLAFSLKEAKERKKTKKN